MTSQQYRQTSIKMVSTHRFQVLYHCLYF